MSGPVALTEDALRYRRWRRTASVIGGVLLACEAFILLAFVGAVISERTSGSWALLGTGIVMGVVMIPVTLLGILFGIVLLVERGGARFSIGLPLLCFSFTMLLRFDFVVSLATSIVDFLGYR